MANLFYRNTCAKISFEVYNSNNNLVSLSTTNSVYWFIKTPDNLIYSNDPNIGIGTFSNGVGIYTSLPIVQTQTPGIYYISYVLNKVGIYNYKFQVNDQTNGINLSVSSDIKVIDDGIF